MERLAAFIATADFNPSPRTTTLIRDALVDTLGCILGGRRLEVARKSKASAEHGKLLGVGTSLVFGELQSAPPQTAALLNATAGHALEFDDWEISGNTHPSIVLFPAILGAASDSRLSGYQIMDAYIAGFETIARLGEALNFEHYDTGWHSTMSLGTIGAAAAVARLLRLSAEQTVNTIAIATTRAAGYTCQFGSDTKSLQAGFAAETGVQAGLLAAAGVTGQSHIMDHGSGFAALTAHKDTARIDKAMDKLGKQLALDEYGLLFKPWPSCGYTHRAICCARELRHTLPCDVREFTSEIAQIDIHVPDFHAAILPFATPKDRREALFSLPFCVAIGLLRDDLSLAHLESGEWLQPDIGTLMPRCKVYPFKPDRPELNYDPQQPDRVVIHLRRGGALNADCAYPLGAPQNPMNQAQIADKFCANSGLPADTVEALSYWPDSDDVLSILSTLENSR